MKKAVVLLSGGLDSSTTLYFAKKKGFECHCLIFDYGQRHRKEINAAKKIAHKAHCPQNLIKIHLPWKGSSLLDSHMVLPRKRRIFKGIPSTYVPARNTIFLSFALSYAETINAKSIFIGANVLDYSGYPDCRPRYFQAFRRLVALATREGIRDNRIKIEVPLLYLKKSEIIKLGVKLGVPYEMSWSCYEGKKRPCGICDSCKLRAKGFREAGTRDPSL